MINTIIWDLGNVVIDWNPAYLYRKIFSSENEVKHFLENVCNSDWNEAQDGGRTVADGTELLIKQFPDHEASIRTYYERWDEMLGGEIELSVNTLKELKDKGFRQYGFTNWSAETFPIALERYDFLGLLDGILVSGVEKDRKPFPSFFQLLLDRYNVKASEAIFIDDNFRNIEAARKFGIESIHFISAQQMREELVEKGIL